jgi:hypothetical protein
MCFDNTNAGGEMTVRELMAQLERLDPALDVLCYSEDPDLLSQGQGFRIFEINRAEQMEAVPFRLEDGTPYLKLGKDSGSKLHAILTITSDG